MPCLRSNPKQKAEYLAYIGSEKGNNSVGATDRRLSGSSATSNTSTNSSAAANTAGIDNTTSTTANNSATTTITTTAKNTTNTTTTQNISRPQNPPQSSTTRRRSERAPRQHQHQPPQQLPTPDPSPTLSHRRTPSISPEPQTIDSPNPNRELTPAERAERRHRLSLEKQHLRMGIYGWSGRRLHGALHSGRRHDYVGQGRTAAVTKRERDEDRAALAAVGVFVRGL